MGREKKNIGSAGENIASAYLRRVGYKILESNFRTPFGEIDLVARKNGVIVFVEVRSRTSTYLGPPYISITKTKQRHIIKNALFYLKQKRMIGANWRIDIVSVKLNYNREVENIELIENAVEDDYI